MTWPASTVSTANVDASGDNPATARADLLDAIQKLNQIINHGAPVLQAGTQTIDGAKTFSSSLSVPAGTAAGHAVNKTQMEDAIGSSNPSASSTTAGHVELATNAETQFGSDSTRAVTPAGLANTMLGGQGQAWTNMTASRAIGTTVTNSTGRPIFVSFYLQITTGATDILLNIDGHYADRHYSSGWPANSYATLQGVVPQGKQYTLTVVSGSANLASCEELR